MICMEVFTVPGQLPVDFIFGEHLFNHLEQSTEDSDWFPLLSTECKLALTDFSWVSIKQIMDKNVFVIWVIVNDNLSYLSPTWGNNHMTQFFLQTVYRILEQTKSQRGFIIVS